MSNNETVTLSIDVDVLYQLMLMAHERDITLNQLINLILQQRIEQIS